MNDGSFYWTGGIEVDADGAPDAYNPSNTGIDYLANAGSPGDWWGISTDSSGTPYVQVLTFFFFFYFFPFSSPFITKKKKKK